MGGEAPPPPIVVVIHTAKASRMTEIPTGVGDSHLHWPNVTPGSQNKSHKKPKLFQNFLHWKHLFLSISIPKLAIWVSKSLSLIMSPQKNNKKKHTSNWGGNQFKNDHKWISEPSKIYNEARSWTMKAKLCGVKNTSKLEKHTTVSRAV